MNQAYSELRRIKVEPVLYDKSKCTAILSVKRIMKNEEAELQTSIDQIYNWAKKKRVKLNETKSIRISFTNRRTLSN